MKQIFEKIRIYIVSHKKLSGIMAIIFLGVLFGLMRGFTSDSASLEYVLSSVENGSIVSSIEATGQVESSSEFNLSAKASGEITAIKVKAGDSVKRGTLLFALDSTDARRMVRNAETDLDTAKLELEKFKAPPKTTEVLELEKAIDDANLSIEEAKEDVTRAFRTLLNSSTVAISSVPGTSYTAPTVSGTYTKDKEATLKISVYQTGSGAYFNIDSIPSGAFVGTGVVSTSVAQPIGDSGLYIKFSSSNADQPTWFIYLPNKTVSAYDTNYKSYQDALAEQKKTEASAALTIAQKKQALDDLYTPDALTLRSYEIEVKKAEDNLLDAKVDLAKYYVYAPFDGVISSVSATLGDTASGALGTIITAQKIANVSLNEVDVAKVQLGDKATVTFDAIEDLSMTGEVVELDAVGAVSQGVVSYSLKIAFDTDDERIKPGMSVSASIISDVKTDILIAPISSVKNQDDLQYVEVFPDTAKIKDGDTGVVSSEAPIRVTVTTGISNDSSIEIVSGLAAGDQIISRTINKSTQSTSTRNNSILPGSTGGRSSGFMMR